MSDLPVLKGGKLHFTHVNCDWGVQKVDKEGSKWVEWKLFMVIFAYTWIFVDAIQKEMQCLPCSFQSRVKAIVE